MIYEDYKSLHQIPELGFKEFKTSTYVLKKLSLTKAKVNVINTGICAFFDFKKRKTIAFRCELDGLKIKEDNNISFKSLHNGYMHACGHDGHMSILLSLSYYINNLKDFNYNILLIFQPSEEKYGGALSIIPHLINYNIVGLFGMHFFPSLENNEIYTSNNITFSSSTEIDIKTNANCTHIGNYSKNKDAIYLALKTVNELQKKAKKHNLLFKYGFIKGGTSRNITASSCLIKGSIRGQNETDTINFLNSIKPDKKIKIKTSPIIPPLINDYNLSLDLINNLNIKEIKKHFFQAEDFSFYGKYFPCVFFLQGINSSELHTSSFLIEKENLISGLNFYIRLLKYINISNI